MRKAVWAWAVLTAVGWAMGTGAAAGASEPESKPGVYHSYFMKGSLLEVDNEAIYLCVGTKDGAKAGQQIDVFRYTRDRSGNPKSGGGVSFKRTKVGRIEILEVVDEHMARAKTLDGKLREGDMAELEQPGG
mgnify:CR=1 FL=1